MTNIDRSKILNSARLNSILDSDLITINGANGNKSYYITYGQLKGLIAGIGGGSFSGLSGTYDQNTSLNTKIVSMDLAYNTTFNVKSYGAVGDGTADDTTAVQAALNAATNANGGIVFFPTGTYKITATLNVQSNAFRYDGWQGGGIIIRGAGANKTRLVASGGTGFQLLNFVTNKSANCSVEDISLNGPTTAGTTAGSVGMNFNVSPMFSAKQVYIRDFEVGVQTYDCTQSTWINCAIKYCVTGMKTGYNWDAHTMIDCMFNYNTTGFLMGWATGAFTGTNQENSSNMFQGCLFNYNVTGVVISDIGSKGTKFNNCYWEGNTGNDLISGNAARADATGPSFELEGCWFSGSLGTPTIGILIYNPATVRIKQAFSSGTSVFTVFCDIPTATQATAGNAQVLLEQTQVGGSTATLRVGARTYSDTSVGGSLIAYSRRFIDQADAGNFSGTWKSNQLSTGTSRVIEEWYRANGSTGASLGKVLIQDVGGVLHVEGAANGNGYIAGTQVSALPSPTVNFRNCIAYVPGNGTTTEDASFICELLASGSYAWIPVGRGETQVNTATAVTVVANTNYIPNNAGLVTYTLPAAANVGDRIRITGKGAGGWKVAQIASSQIHGLTNSTVGVGGSLASSAQYDAVELVCITANLEWVVQSSKGTLTIV